MIFGEVLFDRFPDVEVLGGAPFNVAWHLRGFGEDPLLVSRVGDDEAGRRALDSMRDWGLDPTAVGVDSEAPTGVVDVRVTGEGHAFDILPDRAYDRIEVGRVPADTRASLICHGTLALRTEANRRALERLRRETGARSFCDVNLRPPWVVRHVVDTSLACAHWIKLNDEELAVVSGRPADGREARVAAARAVLDQRGLRAVFVTSGERGALAVARGGVSFEASSPSVPDFVDTVGAGDAFTAVVILGLRRNWSLERILNEAVAFAARMCARRGATVADPALYEALRRHDGEGGHDA